ncbi:MAG: hypothetical protein SPK36_00255 [Bacilli bacterium]|nr:hypothetical protein [Bacilli bacterium]
MNDKRIKKIPNKYHVFMLVLTCCVVGLSILGVSYAYWRFTYVADKANNATSGCFNIELTDQKDEINLTNAYPITDADGLKLKPFSFTLRNTCSIFAHYYVNLEMLEGTTLNSKWVATKVNSDAITTLDQYKTTTTAISGSTESRTIAEGYLGSDDSVDYTLSLWMDEDATIDDDVMNKIFKSKVMVVSEPGNYSPVLAGYTKLGDAILANEYQTTPAIAKTKIAAKQAVDVTNTAPIIKWIEKTGSATTITAVKPAQSVIETYNKDTGTGDKTTQASNLTLNDTKLRLFKTKKFDSDTARYSLVDPVYVDPTTLDFSGDQKYYFQTESIYYNQTNQKLATSSGSGDITIYQVTGATKTAGTTTWNNVSYDSTTYKLNTTTLTETELETDKSDKGLYQGTDDYGTTYYYRGNIKNNIVQFAGFYWQIVRINGDGSIRLIYDGTEKNASGVKQSINNKTYQFNSKYNDPAYVGYMYGNPDGTTFDEVHTNTTSSTIKTNIENWYKTNIVDKGYSGYVSNAVGFCGDRTLASGDGVSTTQYSYFGAYKRFENNNPQFTCPEPTRDLYTTTDSSIGNKALTYPVGLITYDELVFAGMDNRHINKLSWAYSTQHYWTMSPSHFYATNGYALEWVLLSAGYVDGWWGVDTSFGARPVINLKSDTLITGGIGTSSDPFVVG